MKFKTQIESQVATGTAPFSVASNTVVSNLNSDLLDGYHASNFSQTGHTHDDRYYTETETDTKIKELQAFAIAMAIALG